MSETPAPYQAEPDALGAARAHIAELERTVHSLRAQLRAAETHYASALRVNEQRREDNEALRRLLVAVLPPDAIYQEARELTRRLRAGG